jgi:NADH-quinone oxidoreductase subunit L
LNFTGLHAAALAGNISTAVATATCLLLVLGASGKSAQIPLYVWLPDAMAGPTPVSALIHAATMVTAGIYMTARLSFLFQLAPIAMVTLAIMGAATALFAATIGTVQNDIKKVLAYSTVSQLGFMFIAAGVGAYAIALFHVVTHAFFKACLFLGSGSVIHGMSGEQDMRQMGGLRKKMPVTFWTFFFSTLAITGFPMMSGFISKDAILAHAFNAGNGPHAAAFGQLGVVLWGCGVLAAGLTSFYMWRVVFMTFFSGKLRASHEVAEHVHESPLSMTVPLVILAALATFGGFLGMPHIFGGHEWISEWLAPVVGATPEIELSESMELGLMGISTAIALLGFGLAFALYAKRIHPVTNKIVSESPWRTVYEGAFNKWYIDELYDTVIVKPWHWVSKVTLYELVDRRIIDALVNGVGWFARSVGFLGQLFQSGNIQRYLAIFAIGLAILLYGWLTPMDASWPNLVQQAPLPQPTDAMLMLPAGGK